MQEGSCLRSGELIAKSARPLCPYSNTLCIPLNIAALSTSFTFDFAPLLANANERRVVCAMKADSTQGMFKIDVIKLAYG